MVTNEQTNNRVNQGKFRLWNSKKIWLLQYHAQNLFVSQKLKQISEDIALIGFHKKRLIKLENAESNFDQDAIIKSQEKIYFATKNIADKLYNSNQLKIS